MIWVLSFALSLIPWWQLSGEPRITPFIVLATVGACLLIVLLLQWASKTLNYAQQHFSVAGWTLWGVVSVSYAALLLVHFPGFLSTDDLYLASLLVHAEPSGWFSFSYSLLVESCYMLFGQIFTTLILQVVLVSFMAWLLAVLLVGAPVRRQWTITVLATVVLLWPLTEFFVLFVNRDAIFTLLLVTLALWVVVRPHIAAQVHAFEIVGLSLALVWLADCRQDAKPILVVFLALVWWWKIYSPKHLRLLFGASFVFSVAVFWMAPRFLEYQSYSMRYKIFSYLNPLSFILEHAGKQALTEEELTRINRVVVVDSLLKDPSYYDIFPAHKGAVQWKISEEDYKNFTEAAHAVLVRHWRWLILNRLSVARAAFHLDRRYNPMALSPGLPEWNAQFDYGLEHFQYTLTSGAPQWASNHRLFLLSLIHSPWWIMRWIFNATLVPFILLLFFGLRFDRRLRLASAMLLARVPVVFALAPAAYFKYYASIWLGGWVLLVVALSAPSPQTASKA